MTGLGEAGMILWCDFETRSECDLKVKGVYNYARDVTTQVLCMAWALDDEEVQVWTPGQPAPDFSQVTQVRAHNAAFERLIWSHVLAPDHGIPVPAPFYCTATQARANCAPGSLEDVGRFAGADMKKDHRGAQLVRKCCIPPFKHTEQDLADLYAYCAQDVRAMRAASQAMRELTEEELADYHVNERINDRGVLVDVPLALAAQGYAAQEAVELQARVVEITKGAVQSVRSPRMRDWVYARVTPEQQTLMEQNDKVSIDKAVRANLLACDDLDPDVREVVQAADDIWSSSVAKFTRMADLADEEDCRVRGAFVFAGGSATGRASSYGLQLHNMVRKAADDPEAVRRKIVRGHPLGSGVSKLLKTMLRPALMAPEGRVFVNYDWSAIEARVLPWLAGDGEATLDVFRRGEDMYISTAQAMFHVEQVTPEQRQQAKVAVLACIAEDELVLTDKGLVPIQHVTTKMRVWDGVEWVRHSGVIYKGYKETISYDGLTATPDHLVWIEGQPRAVPFGFAAASGSRLVQSGSGRAAIRVGRDINVRAPLHSRLERSICRRAMRWLRGFSVDLLVKLEARNFFGLPVMQPATNYSAMVRPAADSRQAALRESVRSKLEKLRRSGASLWVQLGYRGGALGGCQSGASGSENGTGPHRQQQGLRTWELALGHSATEHVKYAQGNQSGRFSCVSYSVSSCSLRRQYAAESVGHGADDGTDSCQMGEAKRQTKRRVWDILNAGPRNRFTVSGRLVHNCGFAGGVGAFNSMARAYGITMSEAEAKRMVQLWRNANKWAPVFWSRLERSYLTAMRQRGHQIDRYIFKNDHLWYVLPSGRVLCYPFARFDDDGGVSYAKASWKPAADATEWPRARLWPGLAAENITQATANDILRCALRRLDAEGIEVVAHIHDEILVECDEADAERVSARVHEIMCDAPAWAQGLPLAAEGAIRKRFGK